ncbi:MAG TPA: hypothetical protein VGB43_08920 [Flavobacterium sp.]|jgi:uncharacterized membrane protein
MKKTAAVIVLVVGLVFISYGMNHMNKPGTRVAEFFGHKDAAGWLTLSIGTLMVIGGSAVAFRKNPEEPVN